MNQKKYTYQRKLWSVDDGLYLILFENTGDLDSVPDSLGRPVC